MYINLYIEVYIITYTDVSFLKHLVLIALIFDSQIKSKRDPSSRPPLDVYGNALGLRFASFRSLSL